MINFIICDDNKDLLKKQKRIIDSLMMQYDIEYKCSMFKSYDEKFRKKILEDDNFKVYLLNVQMDNAGLDIIKMIRNEFDDWISVIIVTSDSDKYKTKVLSSRLYILDYINKTNNYDEILKEDLLISLKHYNNRKKSLKYEYNHVFKQVEFRQILCIEKEPDSKRCKIKTAHSEQTINKTLNDTLKLLDKRFIKTSRSMIVNVDQIEEYNLAENKIIFRNGEHTYQISRGMKKELKKIFEGSN